MTCRVGKIGRYRSDRGSKLRGIEPRSSTAGGDRRGTATEGAAAGGGGDRARHRSDAFLTLIFYDNLCWFRRRALTQRSTPGLGGSVIVGDTGSKASFLPPHSFLRRHISRKLRARYTILFAAWPSWSLVLSVLCCGVLWPHRTHNTTRSRVVR